MQASSMQHSGNAYQTTIFSIVQPRGPLVNGLQTGRQQITQTMILSLYLRKKTNYKTRYQQRVQQKNMQHYCQESFKQKPSVLDLRSENMTLSLTFNLILSIELLVRVVLVLLCTFCCCCCCWGRWLEPNVSLHNAFHAQSMYQ